MDRRAKSPVLILVILIVISLALAGGSFFIFQREHAKNLQLTEQLSELEAKQRITEAKLLEAQKNINSLEGKLKETQGQIEALSAQLQQEKNAKEEALAQASQVKMELDQQKALRSELEGKLTLAQKDLTNAQAQLKDLDAKKKEMEAKAAELENKSKELEAKAQKVELGKIVVTPEKAKAKQKKAKATKQEQAIKSKAPDIAKATMETPSALYGKVLMINKEYNFAVINLGEQDGVTAGTIFSVYSNNKYIGDLQVAKVHDSMSAADFTNETLKNTVREGDSVVRKIE